MTTGGLQQTGGQQAAPRESLRALVPTASEPALDLLAQLLQFDPNRRCSAESALAHAYLSDLHEEGAEPSAPSPFCLDFESDASLDWPQLRGLYCGIAQQCREARDARARAYEQAQQLAQRAGPMPQPPQPRDDGSRQPAPPAGAAGGAEEQTTPSSDPKPAARDRGRRSADERGEAGRGGARSKPAGAADPAHGSSGAKRARN